MIVILKKLLFMVIAMGIIATGAVITSSAIYIVVDEAMDRSARSDCIKQCANSCMDHAAMCTHAGNIGCPFRPITSEDTE